MGKKCPSRVIENVTVIIRLSVDHSIGTFFYPFATIVLLETGMYFDGVWSKLRTKDRRIFLTMLCKYAFSSSLRRASGIETLPVVVNLLRNSILLNKF